MFQATAVQKCLAGLVGMFQADDPAYPFINDDLATSASGLFVQGVHPLVTLENIVNIAPEFASFNYAAWDATRNYPTGTRAKVAGFVYEATRESIAVSPTISVTPPAVAAWKKVDPLSEWLRRVYRESCSNLALHIARTKKLTQAGKSLLDSQTLYSGYGQLIDKIVRRSRFVGFELNPRVIDGLTIAISQFAIQVDTAQTFKLYLYNSSQAGPVADFPITIDRGNTFAWNDLTNALLSYMRGGADTGSSWYIGYYEDDLTGQAIQRTNDLTRPPCATCSNVDTAAYGRWNQYVRIAPFSVDSSYLRPDLSLFDVAGVRYATDTNWGINLAITVSCDISDIFCRNRAIVANALRMQIVADLLQYIGFTTRINAVSDKTRSVARAELSTKPGAGSFMLMYLDELQATNLDFSGLNSVCMPCDDRSKIIKKTI